MQRPTTRSGFTLIELLVVIAIISILVSLTMAAVQKVRARGQDVQCRSDIQQLDAALQNFKAKFGVYPPCYGSGPSGTFVLASYYGTYNNGNFTYATGFNANSPEVVMLKQMFTRIDLANNTPGGTGGNGLMNNTIPASLTNGTFLDPNQCMVFFLSGGAFMSYAGFATSPSAPFTPPSATATSSSRLNNGPFFDGFTAGSKSVLPATYFATVGSGSTIASTMQPWFVDPWGTPYMYLCTVQGNDYPFDSTFTNPSLSNAQQMTLKSAITLAPWTGFSPCRDPNGKFFSPRGVQIYSAGRDKTFGTGGAYTAGSGIYALNKAGGDDYSNFQQTPLGTTD